MHMSRFHSETVNRLSCDHFPENGIISVAVGKHNWEGWRQFVSLVFAQLSRRRQMLNRKSCDLRSWFHSEQVDLVPTSELEKSKNLCLVIPRIVGPSHEWQSTCAKSFLNRFRSNVPRRNCRKLFLRVLSSSSSLLSRWNSIENSSFFRPSRLSIGEE